MVEREMTIYEKRVKFQELNSLNPLERGLNGLPVSAEELAAHLDVHIGTIYRWQMQTRRGIEEEKSKTPEAEWEEFMFHLRNEVMQKGCPAAKMDLYATLKGKKIDKSEQTHKFEIGADEHFEIRREAQRRISEVSE